MGKNPEKCVAVPPDWKDLPAQAFKIILENISLKHYSTLSSVCKSWNQTLNDFFKAVQEISSTKMFTDTDSNVIARMSPSINRMKIALGDTDNKNFTTDGFSKIWNLRKLQCLEINFSKRKFKNPKWFSYNTSTVNFMLKTFKIANVEIECNFLKVLATRAPNLEVLSLEKIPNMINITRGIQHAAVEFKKLNRIELIDLMFFEDFELDYMIPIPTFQNLNTFYARDTCFPFFFFKMFKAPTLKVAIFNSCYTISDKDMADFAKRCPNIEEFKMINRYHCPDFTDSAVEVLSLNLKSLKIVEFDCRDTTLSYRSIRFLLKNATKLESAVFNNIEGFEAAEEIEGFLQEASKLRYPHLSIGKFIVLFNFVLFQSFC